jgi:hypothetical protein
MAERRMTITGCNEMLKGRDARQGEKRYSGIASDI